ncbi:hypothetical protein A9Q99_25865 [Gammaproteobacteria bacterium 45_16_T64]|nr:hypothetical protein A9Q99_25865 [Gammaproteobacteria bacterium 45_16_T64]
MKIKQLLIAITTALALLSGGVSAADHSTIAIAVGGYDLVSYQQKNGPTRGNGHNLTIYQDNIYAFSNAENKSTFDTNPSKYLPAYGGFCAYGASLGKKFYGDPNVYSVVDGSLYLNLDKKVQSLWNKDISGNIAEADSLWRSIKYVPAAEL